MYRKRPISVSRLSGFCDEDVIGILERYGFDTDKDIEDLWADLHEALDSGEIPTSVLP